MLVVAGLVDDETELVVDAAGTTVVVDDGVVELVEVIGTTVVVDEGEEDEVVVTWVVLEDGAALVLVVKPANLQKLANPEVDDDIYICI